MITPASSAAATRYSLYLKRDCPTCQLVIPAVSELAAQLGADLTLYTQDDPTFPAMPGVVDDSNLAQSYAAGIEIVPTLIRHDAAGTEERIVGWDRAEWRSSRGFSP